MGWISDHNIDLSMTNQSKSFRHMLHVIVLFASALTMTACDFRLDNNALIERARAAAEQKQHRAAIIDLKSVLRRDSRNVDARIALGYVYLAVAEPYAAEKEFRRAVEFGAPKSRILVRLGESLLAQQVFDLVLSEITEDFAATDADIVAVRLLRGDAELALGRIVDARRLYVSALEIDPDNPTAYLGLASTYIAEDQVEQAAISIDRAIEVAPDSASARMARGTFRLSRRLPAAAETDLRRALELATEANNRGIQLSALAGLADIYLLKEDLIAAEQNAAKLAALEPNSIAARYTSARVAFAKEDIDRAVMLLQDILKEYPEFRQAHFLYGAVSRVKGNLAQADMYLSSVVASWPENDEARKLLADVRLRQRRPIDAAEVIEPLLNAENSDDHLLAVAGIVNLQTGNYEEGLELFQRSVEADPANLDRKMDLAAIYLSVDKVDQAVAILESLAGTDVDKLRLDVLTIVSLQRKGNLAAAIEKAEYLLEASPENVQLLTLVGGLYQDSEDLVAARSSFEESLRLDPENMAALLRLGRIDIAEDRYSQARLRYRRALQIDPDSTPVIIEMARLAMLEGDVASSVSWLEKGRYNNKSAVELRVQLATHYLSQRRYDLAMQVAQEAVLADGRNPDAHNVLGVVQMVYGDFDSAAENFATAIRFGTDDAVYRYNHARAELKRGDSRAAIRVMQRNHEAHPEHLPTAALLADYYLRNNDFSAASNISRRLQAILPNKAAGLALQGDILAAQNRFDEAVDLYDRALAIEQSRELAVRAYRLRIRSSSRNPYLPIKSYVELHPKDLVARMFLAETYHVNGEIDKAASEYERLLEVNPGNVVALNNLALILLDKGSARAENVAATAYGILPDNGAIADTYGWILLKSGQTEKANRVLRGAAEALPENAEINYHFGLAMLEFGNKREALIILERIVASDQTFASRDAAKKLVEDLRLDQ